MNSTTKVISLYQKIICSLSCIEKITDDKGIQNQCNYFLNKLIPLYTNLILKKEIKALNINVNEIINFCNNCYDKLNIFDLAEDVEYGIKELIAYKGK